MITIMAHSKFVVVIKRNSDINDAETLESIVLVVRISLSLTSIIYQEFSTLSTILFFVLKLFFPPLSPDTLVLDVQRCTFLCFMRKSM